MLLNRDGNVYTLTSDDSLSIEVMSNNIVIDGAGHTLSGEIRLNQTGGVTVKNLVVQGVHTAFYLYKSNDNTFTGNTIRNSDTAFYMWVSWRNIITANTITGVAKVFNFVDKCQSNTINGNVTRDCGAAIELKYPDNEFSNNIFSGCSDFGVLLSADSNVLRNNTLSSNRVNFDVSAFNNDVGQSNTVDGKTIVFWINRQSDIVPSNAGYVVLRDCTDIRVSNLEAEGIVLIGTYNSTVTENVVTRSKSSFNNQEPIDGSGIRWISLGIGIRVIGSQKDNVTGNTVWNKDCGIKLLNSAGIQVADNNITSSTVYGLMLENSNDNIIEANVVAHNGIYNDPFGVSILDSSRNHFIGNTVEDNCQWGIPVLGTQTGNVLFHNNFVNNRVNKGYLQVSMMGPANPCVWDNGEEGNYWSDCKTRYPNASEVPNTGKGDTPFYINENNQDNHPLMAPHNISDSDSTPEPFPTLSPSPAQTLSPSESPYPPGSSTQLLTPTQSASLNPAKTPESGNSLTMIELLAGLVVLTVVLTVVVFYLRRHRRNQ
jgi:parallel beta-helix repeat protein